ncbi:MAG TPA: hypothetical protein VEB66_17065 [Opitutaceae bacterium]|nr:hypothetical protein [Opitutaceae bacterium]
MSSNEPSGAPAEGTATPSAPASPAAPASFGSTRGSGLARGKRPSQGPASASASAAPSDYRPTAIEIVNAPREYQNPFAPAPAATDVNPEPAAPSAAPVAGTSLPSVPEVSAPKASVAPKADVTPTEDIAAPEADPIARAELNILPPERPKIVAAQTWESDGFTASDARPERPRREERAESSEPLDAASIPEKFLYVRPGVTFVPTDPRKWGPGRRDPAPERKPEGFAPREAAHASAAPAAARDEAPRKSGGLFGWIKSLFGGGDAETATAGQAGDHRGHRARHDASEGGQRPHRGGGRRRRGGRGRGGPGAPRGDRSPGSAT